MKAVFDYRDDSRYHDTLAFQYQFPSSYFGVAERTVGDWVIYRKPTRGVGAPGYFAIAQVISIVTDPENEGFFFANVSSFTPFRQIVDFRRSSGAYWEAPLLVHGADSIGRTLQGQSVREISESDFGDIVTEGLGEIFLPDLALKLGLYESFDEAQLRYVAINESNPEEKSRHYTELFTKRAVRDAHFRNAVLTAYDETCAITGLRVLNGGGRAEANAAHIQPVKDNGPDIVRNGLALSSTCHWLFDRHLISLSDDYEVIVSPSIPRAMKIQFPKKGDQINLPSVESLRPSPQFLQFHRDEFNKKHR